MKASGETKLLVGIVVVAAVLVGVVAGPILLSGGGKSRPGRPSPQEIQPVDFKRDVLVPQGSVIRGLRDAPYTLVVFGDYLCPMCRTGEGQMDNYLTKYKDRLNLVAHMYQLKETHLNSKLLARASRAAALQNKMWEMHAKLFGIQDDLKDASAQDAQKAAEKLARGLGLDMVRFKADMEGAGQSWLQMVEQLAQGTHVEVTPTYFLIRPNDTTLKFVAVATLGDYLDDKQHMLLPGEPKPQAK